MDPEALDRRWLDVQRRVVACWGNDCAQALEILREFLEQDIPARIRSEALAYQAETKEQQGAADEAANDFVEAHRLSEVGTYSRYTLELRLGRLDENRGRSTDALSWYRTALKTCTEGDLSCGSALQAFLRIRKRRALTTEDHDLVERAVKRSWDYFEMSATPPDDPEEALKPILAAERKSPSHPE